MPQIDFRPKRTGMAGVALMSVLGAIVIGCGGGGGGGTTGVTGITNSTNTTNTTNSTNTTNTTNTTNSTNTTNTTATATATTATAGVLPSNVIYYSEQTGTSEVDFRYISPDGSGENTLATLPTEDTTVAPNPAIAGQKVFGYRSNPDGSLAILRNNTISPTGATQIVPASYGAIYSIQVSPDGTQVYYTASVGVGNEDPQLFRVSINGGETPTVIDAADDFHLSLDGTKIVYSKLVSNQGEIFVRGTGAGSQPSRLTTNTVDDILPQWNKAGTQIVFSSLRDVPAEGGLYEVWRMNANGTSPTRITTTPDLEEVGASFNGDGTQVSYAGFANTTGEVQGLYRTTINGGRSLVKAVPNILPGSYWTGANGRSKASPSWVRIMNKRRQQQKSR